MKVCVVTVTYGDRFELLKQVIEASFKEGVNKVIVVDNASVENSRNKLKEYEEHHKDKIKVIYLDENTGSASGFKRGLEEAYKCPDCEYIWLLDDDNMPLESSLKALIDFWNSLKEEDKEYRVALLSYRFKREFLSKIAVIKNKPELVFGFKNSFLGFHIKTLPDKILRKFLPQELHEGNKKKFGIVSVAPYGGLFIHKKIIDKIGYPLKDFYLYVDDYEWTYRITKKNGKIYLILNSIIEDLTLNELISTKKIEPNFFKLARGDKHLVYYTIRNRVFFEINNTVNNKLIYLLNVFVYLSFITLSNIKNVKIFIKAIKDGLNGKLGKIKNEI